ncbi:MAG TPA: hypothetical protein VFS42_08670 [Burkholderiaceae bacterium]|nr:hypothetical protein [Burkholderiaceae bacterium]
MNVSPLSSTHAHVVYSASHPRSPAPLLPSGHAYRPHVPRTAIQSFIERARERRDRFAMFAPSTPHPTAARPLLHPPRFVDTPTSSNCADDACAVSFWRHDEPVLSWNTLCASPLHQQAFDAEPSLFQRLRAVAELGYCFVLRPGKKVDGVYPGWRVAVMSSGRLPSGDVMHPRDTAFAMRQTARNIAKVNDLFARVELALVDAAHAPPRLTRTPTARREDERLRVAMLNDTQRERFGAALERGRLLKPNGSPLDTTGWRTQNGDDTGIFVLMPNERFYVASGMHFEPGAGLLKETSLSGGNEVLYAGVVGTDASGRIQSLSDYSPGYEPSLTHTESLLRWLKAREVDIRDINLAQIYAV